jgi:hypothetical protein
MAFPPPDMTVISLRHIYQVGRWHFHTGCNDYTAMTRFLDVGSKNSSVSHVINGYNAMTRFLNLANGIFSVPDTKVIPPQLVILNI